MVTFCSSESAADRSWKVRRGRAERDLVAVDQDVLVHALAAQERAVQAAEVAEQEPPVGLADDLRVLLGDDAVEDLQRVVGVPADGVDGTELVLAPLVVAGDDNLGHSEPVLTDIITPDRPSRLRFRPGGFGPPPRPGPGLRSPRKGTNRFYAPGSPLPAASASMARARSGSHEHVYAHADADPTASQIDEVTQPQPRPVSPTRARSWPSGSS